MVRKPVMIYDLTHGMYVVIRPIESNRTVLRFGGDTILQGVCSWILPGFTNAGTDAGTDTGTGTCPSRWWYRSSLHSKTARD